MSGACVLGPVELVDLDNSAPLFIQFTEFSSCPQPECTSNSYGETCHYCRGGEAVLDLTAEENIFAFVHVIDDQTSSVDFASTDQELIYWVMSNDGEYLGGATVNISGDRAICKIDMPIIDIPNSTQNGDQLVFETSDLAGNRSLIYWTLEGL
jgi:hypothetical protein